MGKKSPTTIDENADIVRAGKTAQLALSEMSGRIAEREQRIISRLVSEYRSDSLTNDALRGGIGAIAELRSVMDDMKRKMNKGFEAMTEEFQDGPARRNSFDYASVRDL